MWSPYAYSDIGITLRALLVAPRLALSPDSFGMHPNVAMNAKLSWPETPFLPVNDLVHVFQDVSLSQARDEMENWFV